MPASSAPEAQRADVPATIADSDRIDLILPVLYEAAMDEVLWPAALERLAELFAADAVGLMTVEKGVGRLLSMRFSGFAERLLQGFSFSPEEDLLYQASLRDPTDQPIVGMGVKSDAELRTSRLYQTLMVPQELEYTIGGRFENTDRVYSALGLFRKGERGPFGSQDRELLRRLLPHIRAAVRVSRRLGQAEGANHASRVTMQFARHGVILLDRAGNVIFANAEATRIGTGRDGIDLRKNVLGIADGKASTALQRFIESAGPARSRRRAECRLRIPRPTGRLPFEILAIRLEDAMSDGSLFPDGSAYLALVSDPVEVFNVSRQTLVNYYGLSITQARLCRALLRTGSLAVAAEQIDIGMNSARTHLRRAYEKLGITTQLDLLLLLGSTIRASEHGSVRDQLPDL